MHPFFQRLRGSLERAHVRNEAMWYSNPYIHSGVDAGRSGPLYIAPRVVEQYLA